MSKLYIMMRNGPRKQKCEVAAQYTYMEVTMGGTVPY